MKKTVFTLDPRTKMLLILVMGTMVTTDTVIFIEVLAILFISFLFFTSGQVHTAIKGLLFFISLIILEHLPLNIPVNIEQLFHGLCFMLRRFLMPVMAAKYAMSTTPIGVLISSLEKMKVPNVIIIPVAVMFRFFPTLREEFRGIQNAMAMRGIGLNIKNVLLSPMMSLEYVFVPMLISSSKIGDELAAAAHTKCIDDPCIKVRYKDTSITLFDYIVIFFLIAILTLSLVERFS